MKQRYVFGNWKLYLNVRESERAVCRLARIFPKRTTSPVVPAVFPSTLSLAAAAPILRRSSVQLGAQDVSARDVPMSTGDASATELARLGCSLVLVGHSERRSLGESDALINAKLRRVTEAGMTPVLCVGENRHLPEAQAQRIVQRQFRAAVRRWNGTKLFLVYEPVWAISKAGKGTNCAPETAKAMAVFLHRLARTILPRTVTILLYGGSAKSANIAAYADGKTFRGALPGFASTRVAEMQKMVKVLS